ncbi:MAG TPA: DsbA family oxidoreductase [Solirubrobacteraceae bacterium]|nr:DsbA family oxidoreductase [Solirubrobacteraceae bacterium]
MQVVIWSDIACPWCYIGKRRFEAALADFEHADELEVVWRSFELDPQAPPERDGDLARLLARKYGIGVEQARETQRQMTEAAAAEGLEFHFDRARSGSTFDGHRLIHLAAAHNRQDAMKERLLRAYFTEGRLISDPDTLLELGGEVGLPAEEVHSLLATDRFGAEVRAEEQEAASLGISGVPTFIVERRIGVTGAQPAEILLEMLRRGWAQRTPAGILADGESCGVGGC